jgi:hypothetical protein
MSMICDVCQKIFRTGVSPLGLGQAQFYRAGVKESNIPLPFNTKPSPHHPTVDSLWASAREGCYICLILLKFLLSKYSATELQSLTYKASFTTYEHHGKANPATQHPFHFDIIVRHEDGFGVLVKALPARGRQSLLLRGRF